LHKADWTAPEKPEAKPLDRNSAVVGEQGDVKVKGDQTEIESGVKEDKSNHVAKKAGNSPKQEKRELVNTRNPDVSNASIDQQQQSNLDAEQVEEVEVQTYSSESTSVAEPEKTTDDVMTILLVIIALFLPPLAVFLYEEASKRFILNLVIWLLGVVAFGGVGLIGAYFWGIGGLLILFAVIHAILIVLEVI
jgi:uncharacterized membrane protein YqaE (UPF0057 family)